MKKDNFEISNEWKPSNDYKYTILPIISMHPDRESTFHIQLEQGYVDHTMYPFLPGIMVYLHDVHATSIPVESSLYDEDLFIINYCIAGRCEFRVSDSIYRYVRENYTSIGSLTISDLFYYPSDYYLGFEIYIYPKQFTEETRSILHRFHIDIEQLYKKYNNKENLTILETTPQIQRLWMELYHTKSPDPGLISLNVLKILYHLSNQQTIIPANSSYLTQNHAKLAKEVHDILSADLSRHISMREISGQTRVSETSLKNYFSTMFGMTVSEYMRNLRLQKASELLTSTNLPVSEISSICGYSNQGRFAKVFKEYHGMHPLEYRHSQKKDSR